MNAPRIETLVATDWDGNGLSIQPVLDFIGDALISHDRTTTHHHLTGVGQIEHEVRFDADRVRNTEVHGKAYHAGFVAAIK